MLFIHFTHFNVEEGNSVNPVELDFLKLICILETKHFFSLFSPYFPVYLFVTLPGLSMILGQRLTTSIWFSGTQNQTYLEN